MKIGLVYATKTGHSKKIADAVAQELKVEALDVRTNPRLGSLDLLYVVGGIYGGQSAPELIDFVKTLQSQQVKRVALITSGVSQRTRQKQISEIIKSKGILLRMNSNAKVLSCLLVSAIQMLMT